MSALLADRLARDLAALELAGRRRQLNARSSPAGPLLRQDGRDYVNFTSNDYLGLAAHPSVLARVRDELGAHGFGSGSAALLGGRSTLHEELERELAAYTGFDRALLFSSGYLANLGALGALLERGDHVAHDRLNHASLIDGVRASGAAHHRYPHCDPVLAATRMAAAPAGRAWCVTESLFSMDGDCAPLARLAETCLARAATLYIDDAHGFGVLGSGRGAAGLLDRDARRHSILMVTLGKSLGSVGAAVLGSDVVIDYLVQRARTFVYDTALPPVCAAAALEALGELRRDPGLLRALDRNIRYFRMRAAELALPLTPAAGPIQPFIMGEDARAVTVASALVRAGYYVRPIRPPTVPPGSARLRITLSAAHDEVQIDGLLAALAEALRQ